MLDFWLNSSSIGRLQVPDAQELMIVDNDPPLPKIRDYYKPSEHGRMNEEVKAKLKRARAEWRGDPSTVELAGVLRKVVEGDPKLNRKYLDGGNFPDEVVPILCAAWKAMDFRRVRIPCTHQLWHSARLCSSSVGYL